MREMNKQRLRATLAELGATDSTVEPGPSCLDAESLAAAAEGSLAPPARAAALEHLAACATCRSTVAALSRALADPAVASAMAALHQVPGHRARRFLRVAVSVAAAAALFLAVRAADMRAPLPVPEHRAPAITAGDLPVALSPLGPGPAPDSLRWGTVPGADAYRVTLFDASGRLIYEDTVRDAGIALPDTIVLQRGASYFWKVEGRTGWERWSASQLFEFSVDGPGAR